VGDRALAAEIEWGIIVIVVVVIVNFTNFHLTLVAPSIENSSPQLDGCIILVHAIEHEYIGGDDAVGRADLSAGVGRVGP
jgi:hypothetical protein